MAATESRRGYLTIAELEEFADITVTDVDEAYDQISHAEEIIDAYVGWQEKANPVIVHGKVSTINGLTLTDLHDNTPLDRDNNSFKGAEIEIIGGVGVGQRRTIASSNKTAKSITVTQAWATTPDATSVFRIQQLGKFPRRKDSYTDPETLTVYRNVPEAVRRATAAQVEYMIQMGADYFASDQSDKQSESIGNYSYSKGGGGSGGASARVAMTAPKARALLRGIKNSTGRLVVGRP